MKGSIGTSVAVALTMSVTLDVAWTGDVRVVTVVFVVVEDGTDETVASESFRAINRTEPP
jgi:hypothetical protein